MLQPVPRWAWAPVDRRTQDGEPYAGCQRTFARNMTTRAAGAGVSLEMAFEVEWYVGYDEGDGTSPACRGPAYGMTRVSEMADYLADVLDALSAEGVPVEQVHPEYAPGQMELSVGAADPVAAADRLVLVKQTIRAVSQTHGLRPSFAPVVVPGSVGNGGHLHMSVWSGGSNLLAGGEGPCGLTASPVRTRWRSSRSPPTGSGSTSIRPGRRRPPCTLRLRTGWPDHPDVSTTHCCCGSCCGPASTRACRSRSTPGWAIVTPPSAGRTLPSSNRSSPLLTFPSSCCTAGPYHRQAGWLASVYPHVYVDVGLTVGQVGAGAGAVLAEFLELAQPGQTARRTRRRGSDGRRRCGEGGSGDRRWQRPARVPAPRPGYV